MVKLIFRHGDLTDFGLFVVGEIIVAIALIIIGAHS